MKKKDRVVIIGGGLSGLSLAYFLSKKKIQATVLEASPRLGGRIQTLQGTLNTPLELGATWFYDMHQNLLALIDELELQKYPQFSKGISLFQTSPSDPPQQFFASDHDNKSYRLRGGTQMLIDKLTQTVAYERIKLNSQVFSIREESEALCVEISNGQMIRADKVVICLPPQLAIAKIQFFPELPQNISTLLPGVQTWMAGSIKFVLEYNTPFWREKGYSGTFYSHTSIVTEMYDHTNFEESKFGFTGFLNGGAATYSQALRRGFVLQQLSTIFGKDVLNFATYFDKLWSDEFVGDDKKIMLRPHQNNGHPLLLQRYMNGKLFFSGTETATEFSGYMEGAIRSSLRIAEIIDF